MKLTLNENSLFALLLRSPWWASALGVAVVFGVARMFVPEGFAVFAASPFIVITAWVAWKQLRAPSGRRIAARLERLRAMSWDEFAPAIEKGFSRDGYTVKRLGGKGADFELVQGLAQHARVVQTLEGDAHRDRATARARGGAGL